MRYIEIISEDLGSLKDLGVGPLINIIKQDWHGPTRHGRGSRYGSDAKAYPDKRKFKSGMKIGPDSEIVDGGVVKNSAGVRKSFRTVSAGRDSYGNRPEAVGIFIGGSPVAFCYIGNASFTTQKDVVIVAWDFSKFDSEVWHAIEVPKILGCTFPVNKKDVLPKILKKYSSGRANSTVRNEIEFLRKSGYDWPELAEIERSMATIPADEIGQKRSPDKHERTVPLNSVGYDVEQFDYKDRYETMNVQKRFKKTGVVYHMFELNELLDMIGNISAYAKEPMTCKFVIGDGAKRQEKVSNRGKQLGYGNTIDDKNRLVMAMEPLADRLKKFKNRKKPTASNIREFLEAAAKKAGTIRLDNKTYSLVAKDRGYDSDKMSPLQILSGKSFGIDYDCVEPGHGYSTPRIRVHYAYEKETETLVPAWAEWRKFDSQDATSGKDVEAILNLGTYIKNNSRQNAVAIAEFADHSPAEIERNKVLIIKSVLSGIKNGLKSSYTQSIIDALRKAVDWPELDVIEKSLKADAT